MIIAPVVFLTIVIGIAGMSDLGKLGRVVFKAFAYFLFFSSLALVVGLVVANVFQPGANMNIDPAALDPAAVNRVHGYEEQSHDLTVMGFISEIVPSTFVGAFTGNNILPVLFLAIVFGISLAAVGRAGETGCRCPDSLQHRNLQDGFDPDARGANRRVRSVCFHHRGPGPWRNPLPGEADRRCLADVAGVRVGNPRRSGGRGQASTS
jgi:hypothetical protein